jgi:hypothetical protein
MSTNSNVECVSKTVMGFHEQKLEFANYIGLRPQYNELWVWVKMKLKSIMVPDFEYSNLGCKL